MSVRQAGTLVRHEFNAGPKGKEGTLAAFDRSWYNRALAEKLGQRTRLFASPRLSDGTGLRDSCPPEPELVHQIAERR